VASTEEASSVLSERDLSAAIGSTVQGPDGEKIGTVESFFVDDRTGAPTWVAVSTGLFGTKHSIVPATQATFDDGVLNVPVHKDTVRHAPVMGGDHLGPEEETALRQHYGLTGGTPQTGAPVGGAPVGGAPMSGASSAGTETATADAAVADNGTRPVPVPAAGMRTTTEQAAPPPAAEHVARHAVTDGAMTRSEEQLRVGTEQVAATRVRLVKYVVTEEVQVTVPLRREEIRIEHVPLDAPDVPGESLAPAGGQNQAGTAQAGSVPAGGTGTAGLPTEIVLHAERPVVSVEVVPVERVRLTTEVVQGQEQITEQVQREQIVVDQTTSPQVR
jgi:stress response protein YsnF